MSDFTENQLNHFLENLQKNHVEIHAITVLKNGRKMIDRAYDPFSADVVHPLYSITKSFVSCAFGFLFADDPEIELDDPWISYFPEYVGISSKTFRTVTLRNLLCMSLGQDSETTIIGDDDWIKEIIEKEIVYQPGTKFFYNSLCTYLIGRLIEKRTGKTMSDYLNEKLFRHLGITDYYWEQDRAGHNIGGYGLHMKTSDLAKFGQCLLDDGKYDGEQIIPQIWLQEATRKQIDNAEPYPEFKVENRQGYGYQFWMCSDGSFRCTGLFGQLCYVNQQLHLVIALSSCADSTQSVFNCLMPVFQNNDKAKEFSDFQLPIILGSAQSDEQPIGYFRALHNPAGVQSIQIEQENESIAVTFEKNGSKYAFKAQQGIWLEQKNCFEGFTDSSIPAATSRAEKNHAHALFANYAWETNSTMLIQLRARDCSAAITISLQVDADYLVMNFLAKGLMTDLPSFKVIFQKNQ